LRLFTPYSFSFIDETVSKHHIAQKQLPPPLYSKLDYCRLTLCTI